MKTATRIKLMCYNKHSQNIFVASVGDRLALLGLNGCTVFVCAHACVRVCACVMQEYRQILCRRNMCTVLLSNWRAGAAYLSPSVQKTDTYLQ